ncbi:MAG: sulfatase [Microthrixaceae bacterium]|nr:sulfatase [Microthrixaceae bacterium]
MKTLLRFAILAAVLVASSCVPPGRQPPGPPAPPHPPPGPDAPTTRPNIVMIMADDLDATTTPLWDAMPKTKALLADQGLTFDNAFSPTPICCPARATILTGQYGHNTDVLTNGGEHGGWESFVEGGGEERSFPVQLQAAGYDTMLVGKYLNGIESDPTHIPPGWTEWYGGVDNLLYAGYGYTLNENGTLVTYGTDAEDYATDVIAAKTMDYVHRAEADDAQPFFAYVAPTAPHLPLAAPPRYASNPWVGAKAPRTPNWYEPDVSDKSEWLKWSTASHDATKSWNDVDWANRMGSLMGLDDLVAGVVETLDTHGELDNTVLMFISDNGYNLGSHKLVHKMAPYEESVRVPLVMAGPGIRHGTESRMVIEPDLAPTILDLAGLSAPAWTDGTSLVPLLGEGPSPSTWRSDFVGQYLGGAAANGIGAELPPTLSFALFVMLLGQELPTYTSIRTTDHLYVEWDQTAIGAGIGAELYDMAADPYQLDNLLATEAGRSANAALVAQLKSRMTQLVDCAGPTCRS